MWWATLKNSTPIVSDKVNTFHDAWHKGHMTAPTVVENYTPAGIKAIEQNMQVVSPPIYLTGYLEFQDVLGKNLSEAYIGQLPAKDVLKRTTDEWNAHRQSHRPAQAQGRAGELQGGDAEARTSRRKPVRANSSSRARTAAPPASRTPMSARTSIRLPGVRQTGSLA